MTIINIVALLALSCNGDASQIYEEIYTQAYQSCFAGLSEEAILERDKVLKDLIKVEKAFFRSHPNLPQDLRGMLIAAGCRESRFNPKARGDWRINARGKRVPRAIGVVQMWPWWEDFYGVNRHDPVASAQVWLKHIAHQYKKNERLKRCPAYFSQTKKWVAAWVQTTRGGKVDKTNRYRCFQAPTHYKLLKKWKRKIEASQDLECGC
jgi:hypothetical protein